MADHSFSLLAYKESPYIRECLESLLAQQGPTSVQLCTSTPSDFISDLARTYRLPLYINPVCAGMASDWTFGLQQAQTKYVTLAHQDDIYQPGYVQQCLAAAERNRDTLICFTDYTELANGIERKNNRLLRVKRLMLQSMMPFHRVKSTYWKKRMLAFGCPIAAPSVMFNKTLLEGFQFYRDFKINIDWDAWYRLSQVKGCFVYVKEPLMQHRIHEASATSEGIHSDGRHDEDMAMFRRFWPGPIAKAINRLYAGSYTSNHL